MSRFVMVSFAFLGWGFYELSGGADFEPPKRPAAVAETDTAAQPAERPRLSAASIAAQPVLTQRAQIQRPARPAADPALRQRVAAGHLASASGVLATTQTAFSDEPAPGGLQLASLDGGLAAITAAPAAELIPQPAEVSYLDRRSIRASRVNMRQGPGTSYPVITRLLGGEEVIVIEDSGTGWLHLRAPDKGHTGWIAASLVSKKRP
ncbi:SH3 domain-containing protein [Leisingera sp. HS039]|uniref:SH3 domain-containing protein n=1 Tax=unclassified Leisingera TaxID=2614906 RepID=UPI001070AD2C|nr:MULTISPECIES: SH3 domain-containing protein [unclassified Leisingera]MBQ4827134.1 SH3 domain-containing protein [Leisingera sp. HS039]MCF6431614.1 SH3 domain-containing protein [Leisingera sp. MMG026]QBR37717.1 SH3 domain-containing protein [Leisingera sp. NJS201]